MHKTRCGLQARQWQDYFLTGFETCSIIQKVHQHSSKTMGMEVTGPSGELTSVVLLMYKCSVNSYAYTHRQMLPSAFIRETSFCSQQCRVKELREMEKFKNWWLGEGSEMLYSELDTAIAFRNSQHLLRNRGRAVAYPSWRFIAYWQMLRRGALIFKGLATCVLYVPVYSSTTISVWVTLVKLGYETKAVWHEIRKRVTYREESKKVNGHKGRKKVCIECTQNAPYMHV